MRPARLATAAAVICAGALAGCASSTSTGTATNGAVASVRASDVARASAGDVSTAALVSGLTAFGHDLSAQAARGHANVAVSPLSVAVAMSLADAGAHGTTAAQIDAALHFPATDRDQAMNALILGLSTTDTVPAATSPSASRPATQPPKPPVLAIANGLFARAGLPIGAPFLHTAAAFYGAGVQTVDFSSARATQQINGWVQRQTAGRIGMLFDSIDPSTQMVLANVVYLKADWQTPFAEDPTAGASFTRADGTAVSVPTMHLTSSLRYAETADYQAVELPYASGTLAMWVLLPRGDATPSDLLEPTTLDAIRSSAAPTPLRLALPRWKVATDLNLGAALQNLGVRAAFSPSADFSGISPGLFIGQAVHRTTITVDEWGTEAAAVTGLAFAAGGLATAATMDVNHPFAFAIVQTTTGAPIFEGFVADPTV